MSATHASMPRSSAAAEALDLSTLPPFRSDPAEDLELGARLEGELPGWLAGDLLRTAPAIFRAGAYRAQHWFDALGLLYRFRLHGGGVSYRQRVMNTEVRRAIASGDLSHTSFGTPSRRSLVSRVVHPMPRSTDNVNVNVLPFGEERVALTETPLQWAVDPETLALTHRVEYADGEGELGMLAHPHFDFERGHVVNLASRFGRRSEIVLYEHAASSRARRVVARIELSRLPYLHSFGLTPQHAVVIGHPFDVSPLSFLGSTRGFIDHFEWHAGRGTRVWVIDRRTGATRTHEAPAGFVFHVVNAFEDGDRTCIDLALFPDSSIVERLRSTALAERGLPDLAPRIVRWSARAGSDAVSEEVLLGEGFEFPTLNYRLRSGRRHELAFGARIAAAGRQGTLVRFDARAGERHFEREGFTFGEPVFVGRPGASAEDDGVVLAVGSHGSEPRSALVVLDASDFRPRAWAEVPLPIPLGFHGSFFRA